MSAIDFEVNSRDKLSRLNTKLHTKLLFVNKPRVSLRGGGGGGGGGTGEASLPNSSPPPPPPQTDPTSPPPPKIFPHPPLAMAIRPRDL